MNQSILGLTLIAALASGCSGPATAPTVRHNGRAGARDGHAPRCVTAGAGDSRDPRCATAGRFPVASPSTARSLSLRLHRRSAR